MECSSLATCMVSGSSTVSNSAQGGVAFTSDSVRSQRFAELLEAEPQREHIYVAGPDVSASSGVGNPLASFVSQFHQLELSSANASIAGGDQIGTDDAYSHDPEIRSDNQDILQAQANLVRTVVMMEVMSSAKQAVTTLFQQQG